MPSYKLHLLTQTVLFLCSPGYTVASRHYRASPLTLLSLVEAVGFGAILLAGATAIFMIDKDKNLTMEFYAGFTVTVIIVGIVHFGHALLLGTCDFAERSPASIQKKAALKTVQLLMTVFAVAMAVTSFTDAFRPNESGLFVDTIRPEFGEEYASYQTKLLIFLGVMAVTLACLIYETLHRGAEWTRLEWIQHTWRYWTFIGFASSLISFVLLGQAITKVPRTFTDGALCLVAGLTQVVIVIYAQMFLPILLTARIIGRAGTATDEIKCLGT